VQLNVPFLLWVILQLVLLCCPFDWLGLKMFFFVNTVVAHELSKSIAPKDFV
jgi:hypothetical protein